MAQSDLGSTVVHEQGHQGREHLFRDRQSDRSNVLCVRSTFFVHVLPRGPSSDIFDHFAVQM